MIHWRALPQRCRMRLPMLFDSSLARHQICSSVNFSRQRSIFGRYSSTRNSEAQRDECSRDGVGRLALNCCSSDIFVCRYRTALMLRFPPCRTRYFVRLGTLYRMPWRRPGLADTVKNGPRLLTLPFSWRTPSNHNQPPLDSVGFNCAMLRPAEIGCQTIAGGK